MTQKTEKDERFLLTTFLDNNRKGILREAAYCALRRHFDPEVSDIVPDPELNTIKAGVFVTLKSRGDLRGCIGFITPPAGLFELVQESTILAATEDPRFLPVAEDEVAGLEVEITVLDSPKRLNVAENADFAEITIGRDGLMVESRFGKGVLLPQVATEFGFSKREFLEATCQKAGLEPQCWQNRDNKVYLFSAINF